METLVLTVTLPQRAVQETGEKGRGDEKLQQTIQLSMKRLETYLRVKWRERWRERRERWMGRRERWTGRRERWRGRREMEMEGGRLGRWEGGN